MTPAFIKRAREKLGMTQPQLADELDRSERFILSRETGEAKPDKMFQYALFWLLLPQKIRQKYTPKKLS